MASVKSKGINYFNVECIQDDKLDFILAKHKLEGYGIVIQLWRKIYAIDGYFCNWTEKVAYLFCRDNGVELETLNTVIDSCFEEGIFSREMFEKYGVLTSKGIQKRWLKIVTDAKRKDKDIEANLDLLPKTPENNTKTPEEMPKTPVSDIQSKVKKSKEEESKEKKREGHSTFVPPTQIDLENFFLEEEQLLASKWTAKKCKTEAEKFVNKYTSVGWKIGRGQVPMKDWKSSALNWIESEKNWAQQNGSTPAPQAPPVYRSGQTQVSSPPVEPSPEKKKQLAIDVIMSSFADFTRCGHYEDFANTVYNAFTVSLSNITFIKFIENRDDYFESKAKERALVRSGNELDMKSALLKTIEANTMSDSKQGEKLLVEAKKEAVREFYAYLVKENIPVEKILD